MRVLRLFTRSRRRRRTHRTSPPLTMAPTRHNRSEAHTPRLTQLYLSVPGNRGSDDRILIGGGIALALILVAVGGYFVLNAPRTQQVTAVGNAQTTSVRFLGMTESNGVAELQFEENGQEFSFSLPSGNPLVAEVRNAKPGDTIIVPKPSPSLYEAKPEPPPDPSAAPP